MTGDVTSNITASVSGFDIALASMLIGAGLAFGWRTGVSIYDGFESLFNRVMGSLEKKSRTKNL